MNRQFIKTIKMIKKQQEMLTFTINDMQIKIMKLFFLPIKLATV